MIKKYIHMSSIFYCINLILLKFNFSLYNPDAQRKLFHRTLFLLASLEKIALSIKLVFYRLVSPL